MPYQNRLGKNVGSASQIRSETDPFQTCCRFCESWLAFNMWFTDFWITECSVKPALNIESK